MKVIVALYIGLFMTTLTFGQQFSYESSPEVSREDAKERIDIAFASPYGFTTYAYRDVSFTNYAKYLTVTEYDQAMTPGKSVQVDFPKMGLAIASLERVVEMGDQLVILSKLPSKKQKKNVMYAQVFSKGGDAAAEAIEAGSFPIEKVMRSGFYQVAVSPDQSKLAIYASLPFEKKQNEKVKIWVYDNAMNLLWEQSETLDFDSKRAYNEEVFLSNSGKVYVAKTTNKFKKSRAIHLLEFNGTAVAQQPFSKEGFYPMDAEVINANGKSLLAGFYSDGQKPILQMNATEGEKNSGAFLYDLTEMKLIGMHEWTASAKAMDLKSLEVIGAITEGADIFLVGEKQLKDSKFKDPKSTSMEMEYTYTYGDRVIVRMDAAGTLEDMTPVPHDRMFKNDRFVQGSAAVVYVADALRFLGNVKREYSSSDYKMITHFGAEETTGGISGTAYIHPHTVCRVEGYNLMYFVAEAGNTYLFQKVTW